MCIPWFQAVVDCGALEALVICLEEFDPGVKEAAAWALGYIARHNAGNMIHALTLKNRLVRFNAKSCTLKPAKSV